MKRYIRHEHIPYDKVDAILEDIEKSFTWHAKYVKESYGNVDGVQDMVERKLLITYDDEKGNKLGDTRIVYVLEVSRKKPRVYWVDITYSEGK